MAPIKEVGNECENSREIQSFEIFEKLLFVSQVVGEWTSQNEIWIARCFPRLHPHVKVPIILLRRGINMEGKKFFSILAVGERKRNIITKKGDWSIVGQTFKVNCGEIILVRMT